MTEIVLAHNQKHVRGHYFSVGPNASPKYTPDLIPVYIICMSLGEWNFIIIYNLRLVI